MNDSPAQAKILMLKRSLNAFTFGILGLLPVIGFPLAIIALTSFRRACLAQRGNWNAARGYLIWGLVYGAIGLIGSLVTLGFILYLALNDELFRMFSNE